MCKYYSLLVMVMGFSYDKNLERDWELYDDNFDENSYYINNHSNFSIGKDNHFPVSKVLANAKIWFQASCKVALKKSATIPETDAYLPGMCFIFNCLIRSLLSYSAFVFMSTNFDYMLFSAKVSEEVIGINNHIL